MEETTLDQMQGAFVDSLKRNNKQIKEDRAIEIAESASIKYKRKVEDLEQEIKNRLRARRGMMDLSPTTAQSLILATDFNADAFVEADIKLGVEIRNLEIKLKIAKDRYANLFEGGTE